MPKGEKIKIKENVDYACRNKIIFFSKRERERGHHEAISM